MNEISLCSLFSLSFFEIFRLFDFLCFYLSTFWIFLFLKPWASILDPRGSHVAPLAPICRIIRMPFTQIRRATSPGRVRSRKSFLSLFLVLENAYSARKGGPWGPQSSTNDVPFTAKSFKITPWTDFTGQKRHPKTNDFWNPQKSTKISTRGRQSLGLGTKKLPFGIHFGIDVSISFEKCKCVK